MSTKSIASRLEFFNECLDELVIELVRRDLGVEYRRSELSDFTDDMDLSIEEKIQKSAWTASLLASSEDDEHRRKALAFSILSYIKYQDGEYEELYRQYLYIVLSRLGNLPAFDNVDATETGITFEQDALHSLDAILASELLTTRNDHSIMDGYVLSRFQREIYGHLIEGRDVAISGPTSSGKSFILKRYIDHRIESDRDFEAIYVVPTRALITEVSRELSDLNEDIVVQTGVYFEEEKDSQEDTEEEENWGQDEDGGDENHRKDDEEWDDDEEGGSESNENVFLVVTPERCRKLIDPERRSKIDPDLVFFDEVQNVEDDSRGVLFESIIMSLNKFYPDAQIVAAGPYLENPKDTLQPLTNGDVAGVQSEFTPIVQLRVSLTFMRGEGNDIAANIYSPSGEVQEISIPEPDDLTYTAVGNKTDSLPDILEEFASHSKTLVYSGQKNYAEKRARRIAKNKARQRVSPEIEQLKEFLADTIHEEYSLIECLDHGVAFHHGMVPKFAREEIEDIYRSTGDIQTIVTTPTLMQGVNLPADKIFLVGAKRGNQELTDFEFNNLVGRAGRLSTKLYGGIYCIEREDEEWADEKLESTGKKEVTPATEHAINLGNELIDALRKTDLSGVEEPSVRYTAILLRGKYLKDDAEVIQYLERKGMDPDSIREARGALEQTLGDVDVPEQLLKQNPTVDPVNLNQLYDRVAENPEDWTLGGNRFKDIYDDLLYVSRKMNEVFKFTNDDVSNVHPENIETEYGALEPIIVNATQWLEGKSYQDMIESRRDADSVPHDEPIDKSIREVMKIVDNDISFLLVKYFGILTEILEATSADPPEWMFQLDRMLEMGSIHFAELKLMSRGVDRSIAVDLNIPKNVEDPVEFLNENPHLVPDFHRIHLEKQDIL